MDNIDTDNMLDGNNDTYMNNDDENIGDYNFSSDDDAGAGAGVGAPIRAPVQDELLTQDECYEFETLCHNRSIKEIEQAFQQIDKRITGGQIEGIFFRQCAEGTVDKIKWLLESVPVLIDMQSIMRGFRSACMHNNVAVAQYLFNPSIKIMTEFSDDFLLMLGNFKREMANLFVEVCHARHNQIAAWLFKVMPQYCRSNRGIMKIINDNNVELILCLVADGILDEQCNIDPEYIDYVLELDPALHEKIPPSLLPKNKNLRFLRTKVAPALS